MYYVYLKQFDMLFPSLEGPDYRDTEEFQLPPNATEEEKQALEERIARLNSVSMPKVRFSAEAVAKANLHDKRPREFDCLESFI
jgi:hypothetical protein